MSLDSRSRSGSVGRINKERSHGSRPASPIKQRQPIKQGVDLGIDLLVNKKFSPPTSPSHPKPRSLRLSGSSSEGSFDDRFSRLVQKNKRPNDRREDSLKSGMRREVDRSDESTRMVPRSERSERRERGGSERSERRERSERSERRERSERSERWERGGSERSERRERERGGSERSERRERERGGSERSERRERERGGSERSRSERKERGGFFSRFGFGGKSDRSDGGIKKFGERSKGDGMPSFHGSDFEDSELDKDINDIVIEESSRGDREDRGGWGNDAGEEESGRRDLLDSEFERDRDRDRGMGEDDNIPAEEKMSPAELLKLKRKKLLHIKVMTMQGYEPFRAVGLMNTLEEINEVEEEQMARRGLANAIEFQKKLLVGFSFLVEVGNKKYDPFNLDLNGWSEQIFEEKDEYDEVLEELYYKYGDHVAMMPEVKLVLMLGMSAMMFHFSKKVMDNGNLEVPGFEQIMKNNPDLKHMYTEAAKREVERQSGGASIPGGGGGGGGEGGMGGFMSGLLGSMTGNQQTGNMLNQFMNFGGRRAPMGGPGTAAAAQKMAGRARATPQAKRDIDILSPVDPDNILENSFESASMSAPRPNQQRKTRQSRNNINGLV